MDAKMHGLECVLAENLKESKKIPTRTQRILLRFLKLEVNNVDVNFNFETINHGIIEYMMVGIAIIKRYLSEIPLNHQDLLVKTCQVQ